MPPVVQEVLRLTASKDAQARDLADAVSQDQGLASKLLRLANSAYYGLSRQVSSVPEAVNVVGFSKVRTAAIASAAYEVVPGSDRELRSRLWRHSVAVASVCNRLAVRSGHLDPEEAVAAGLLHDSGVLVFDQVYPREYRAVREAVTDEVALPEVEAREMGLTHAELGSRLLIHWSLPIALTIAAAGHHTPEPGHAHSLLVAVVHVANEAVARSARAAADLRPRPVQWNSLSELLPVREEDFEGLVEEAAIVGARADHFLQSIA